MKRDEVLAEMLKVADALENRKLTDEQMARGQAKYADLEAELNRITETEKQDEEARKQAEREANRTNYPPQVAEEIAKIREILGKKP